MSRLTDREASDAADYNTRKARSVGWIDKWAQIFDLMALPPATLTAEIFAQRCADWQADEGGLTVDGKLGPTSWSAMESKFTQSLPPRAPPAWLEARPAASPRRPGGGGGGSRRIRPDVDIPAGGSQAPWLDVALAQMRAHFRSDGSTIRETGTTRDEDYFDATPYYGGRMKARDARRPADNADWCAAFVNYCLHTAGYSHCGSAGANGFTRRGWWNFEVLETPKRGCVIVVGEGGQHVSFLDRWDDLPDNPDGDVPNRRGRNLYLFGGNQGTTVRSNLENRTMISVKKGGVRSPYLWPLAGGSGCNCDLPTAAPHFCHAQWQ